jgi:hypothetical protein
MEVDGLARNHLYDPVDHWHELFWTNFELIY